MLLAAGLFLLGVLAWVVLKPEISTGRGPWVFIRIMGLLFLTNGLYGLVSGRVFGRSWKKYWGGWCYRNEEPYYYWSYTLGHLAVGILLELVGR